MKSYTDLTNLFTNLSQNTSSANNSLATILINDAHRYLILRFFDNEGRVSISTVGPQSLSITGTLATATTNATLGTAWSYPSTQQLVVFDNSQQRLVSFNQNQTSITWTPALTTATTTKTIATVGVQSYPLPANVSKVKNDTITIGQLVYTPAPVQSIQEWTKLNALPYTSDIPAYFYIYNKQLMLWPIPSSTGNVMDIYCQIVVPDMTYSNYTTGTLATMTVGSNIVTGSGTNWSSTFPLNTDLTGANLYLTATPPNGDGIPYQIQSFTSGTTAVLTKPVVSAPNTVGASYLIGQYPLLDPNFHDTIVYWALQVYFSSIRKDPEQASLFKGIFDNKYQLMEGYLSTKQVNVDLSVTPVQQNPNLYIYATPTS